MPERLTGTLQPYAWGSTTFIPDLLGEQPTGQPQAELWLGAHGSASSTLGDRSLDAVIAEDPAGIVGTASVRAFGNGLPFLLKVLAAAKPLSLQAHPSREQAEQGFAREQQAGVSTDAGDRLYKDAWPKPEMLCALMDSEALCGFRDPGETHGLFTRLGVGAATVLVAPLADTRTPPAERLAGVFARLLRLQGSEREVVREVAAAAATVVDGGELGLFARTARELGEHYDDDPGVLAALLLNRITLRLHEAVYLSAGNLHAYLSGGGVEIMANSDNVIRGGLTAKRVDVDELLDILDFTPASPCYVQPVEISPGCWHYPTSAPEFALWRLEPRETSVEVPASALARVLLVTDGSASRSVVGDGEDLQLRRGQSAFARAGEALTVGGSGTVFVAGPGVDG
ncbi:MAG: Mannose-6-phosphate isomerase [uncultured Friedmanniella sp.]|uniref:mannose-6-phosphate isomerase n=1 Tax=uncultured Friedmanniella sp. TaxID=335381 RepID=A0A6J4KCQ2_9ACTN|nr:mannose-6-phosphate isomerase, class I [uncultured Friedmanniella sp.]CAA9301674.1 MAG: Mannose-6-phosphate isomerase [uncultured Friedmanniella sp.]